MRSSAIVALVALATVSPAFAAPLSAPAYSSYARRATSSGSTSSSDIPPSFADESGALKLPSLGTLGTIFSFGAPIVSGIIDHFKNKGDQQQQQQARELESILARAETDESGALKLPSLGTLGTIFSFGAPIISGIIDHFKNNGDSQQQQQARELEAIFARAETDESGALKLPSLGTLGTIFSFGAPIVSGIIDHFKNNGDSQQQQQARELEAIFARAEFDESGAFKLPSLGDAASIASIGSSIVSAFHNIFGGDSNQQRREELIELLARAEFDESGAFKLPSLGDAASIASIGSSIVSAFHNIFGGNSNQQSRELIELLARAEVDESGAFSFPSFDTLKNIGSIGGSAFSILHNIFGGSSDNNNQQRELFEQLLARAETDESGALKLPSLGTLGTIFSFGAPIVSGIIDHFKNNGDSQQQQQARELEALMARADFDESGALKLPSLSTLGTLFSFGAPVISGLIDHFKNNGDSQQQQQARELETLFARADFDESGALKLPSLNSILGAAGILGGGADIFHSIFGGGDSQQQSRELMDLLARADFDESGALKLPSLNSILGAAGILGGGADIFNSIFGKGSSNQQQRRELIELLTRDLTDEQSAALSLSGLGGLFSFAEPIIGGLINTLTGNKQSRDLDARLVGLNGPLRLTPIFNPINRFPTSVFKPLAARSLNDLD